MKHKKQIEVAIKLSSSKILYIYIYKFHLFVGYIINQKYLLPPPGKIENTTRFLRVVFPTISSMAPKRVWLFRT